VFVWDHKLLDVTGGSGETKNDMIMMCELN